MKPKKKLNPQTFEQVVPYYFKKSGPEDALYDVIDILIPYPKKPKQHTILLPSPQEASSFQEVKYKPKQKKPKNRPARWKALYENTVTFYINKLASLRSISSETKRWIRNACDERAAQEGMRFSEHAGEKVVKWVSSKCYLYEGEKAGFLMDIDDWQYEYFMQLFGWLRYSEEKGKWIRRFRKASIWIAKKNAKSPTLAATGVYCFMGEGEQGNHCYSMARDGKQALIAHTHATEMIRISPDLSAECKIKLTDHSILHKPTKSTYELLHAGNSRSAEGINGSVFIDEIHVVDQDDIDRIARAGISRTQPLHIEMSTAGNNVDGYGYNRYQYGKRVANLETSSDYVPDYLFMDFSVDQSVPLEELRNRDFISSIAGKCNPTMGRIISREEFMSDWMESCRSETELRKFAMYRLNLWLKDSAAWLNISDWLACAESPLSVQLERQYTLEDLQEFPCVAGLDLSKVRDMTALSLIFAVPDEDIGVRLYTWTWHWLPEESALLYSRYIDFFAPELSPWIEFIKSPTIDYDVIAAKLEWIRQNFDLRGLGYDTWNSSDLVRYLIVDWGWGDDDVIKVPQSMKYMGPITKEFERWVVRKEIHHPNNLLLNWQFQHAALENDRHGNYKVIKPDRTDYRKVDGIISLLIAGVVLCSDPDIWSVSSDSILLYEKVSPETDGRPSKVNPLSYSFSPGSQHL